MNALQYYLDHDLLRESSSPSTQIPKQRRVPLREGAPSFRVRMTKGLSSGVNFKVSLFNPLQIPSIEKDGVKRTGRVTRRACLLACPLVLTCIPPLVFNTL